MEARRDADRVFFTPWRAARRRPSLRSTGDGSRDFARPEPIPGSRCSTMRTVTPRVPCSMSRVLVDRIDNHKFKKTRAKGLNGGHARTAVQARRRHTSAHLEPCSSPIHHRVPIE
eukprot:3703256-Prymnesium_polylepis.1